MAKPVAVQPPLPNPTGNVTNIALNNFDQDLVRALTSYLGGVALRLNTTITNDGTEPMKADLNMGGYSITSVNNITGTGTATFATGEFTDLTVTNLTVTGTADLPPITDLTLTSLETDTLVVNTSATVPTPDPSDDSTAAATTEWVNDAIAAIDTSTFVTLTGAQTITDKTLTEPIITLEQGSSPSATDSGRIQWDTDENALVVGNGTDTTIIRGGAWELIAYVSSSSFTQIPITDLGDFVLLRVTGHLRSVSTAGYPFIQLSSDNGATWLSADYRYLTQYARSTTTTSQGLYSISQPHYDLTRTLGISTTLGVYFETVISDFNKSTATTFMGVSEYITGSELFHERLGGFYNSTGANDAISINGSQALSGYFIIEGIRG